MPVGECSLQRGLRQVVCSWSFDAERACTAPQSSDGAQQRLAKRRGRLHGWMTRQGCTVFRAMAAAMETGAARSGRLA